MVFRCFAKHFPDYSYRVLHPPIRFLEWDFGSQRCEPAQHNAVGGTGLLILALGVVRMTGIEERKKNISLHFAAAPFCTGLTAKQGSH